MLETVNLVATYIVSTLLLLFAVGFVLFLWTVAVMAFIEKEFKLGWLVLAAAIFMTLLQTVIVTGAILRNSTYTITIIR